MINYPVQPDDLSQINLTKRLPQWNPSLAGGQTNAGGQSAPQGAAAPNAQAQYLQQQAYLQQLMGSIGRQPVATPTALDANLLAEALLNWKQGQLTRGASNPSAGGATSPTSSPKPSPAPQSSASSYQPQGYGMGAQTTPI